jgi:hypothetical protein
MSLALEEPGVSWGAPPVALMQEPAAFAPRVPPVSWPTTRRSRDDVLDHMASPPFAAGSPDRRTKRATGAKLLLRHTIQDRGTGQGRSCSPTPASVGDLNPFAAGAIPRLRQDRCHLRAVGRQPEVRPAYPAALPPWFWGPPSQKINGECRRRTRRERTSKATPSHESTGRQLDDPGLSRFPGFGHVGYLPRRQTKSSSSVGAAVAWMVGDF